VSTGRVPLAQAEASALRALSLPGPMEIRIAVEGDADAVSALIRSVAHFFTLHPDGEGAEDFLKTLEPDAIRRCITSPRFAYHVGHIGGELVGVVAVRDTTHLYHLFVAQTFQGRGFARALWRKAREVAVVAGNMHGFTVNSTPFAVPVYERFGFEATGPRREMHGIAFVPMALRAETQASA